MVRAGVMARLIGGNTPWGKNSLEQENGSSHGNESDVLRHLMNCEQPPVQIALFHEDVCWFVSDHKSDITAPDFNPLIKAILVVRITGRYINLWSALLDSSLWLHHSLLK